MKMEEMERRWKFGDDLIEDDNLLDQVSFRDVILAVHYNCRVIDQAAVRKTVKEIQEQRVEDMEFLLERNMDEIIKAAKRGREG